MISGLSGFGRAAAVALSAGVNAQSRLEKSAGRIATGTKVASVKEDGAGYIRDQYLKNESASWDYRANELKRYRVLGELVDIQMDDGLTLLRESQKLLAFAALTPPNSDERRRYYDEWVVLRQRAASLDTNFAAQHEMYNNLYTDFTASGEWAYDPYDTDPYLDNIKLPDTWFLSSSITSGSNSPGYTPDVFAVNNDFVGASQALMASAANEQLTSGGPGIGRTAASAADLGGALTVMDKMQSLAEKFGANVEIARSKMFDVDMTAESAKLRAAQVAGQLAQSSISIFTEGYRKMAMGLLGNVLNTQGSLFSGRF